MYTDEQIKTLRLVQKTAKSYGVKAIADRLNVTAQTTYSDIDPNSIGRRTNKLGLLDWDIILEETGDLSSLQHLNLRHNQIALPFPKPAADMTAVDWMGHCARAAKEAGEAVAELAESIMDGRMKHDELNRCEKETHEALTAFASLFLAIREAKAAENN